MTLNEMTAALNNPEAPFTGDYGTRFDISNDEAERIAERVNSADEFCAVWENEAWWKDEA